LGNDAKLVDSHDGIALLVEWARRGGFVLSEAHKRIAEKYGVDTAGVAFAGKIPTRVKETEMSKADYPEVPKLTAVERDLLRDLNGEKVAAMGAAVGYLQGIGYLTRGANVQITDAGREALQNAKS